MGERHLPTSLKRLPQRMRLWKRVMQIEKQLQRERKFAPIRGDILRSPFLSQFFFFFLFLLKEFAPRRFKSTHIPVDQCLCSLMRLQLCSGFRGVFKSIY